MRVDNQPPRILSEYTEFPAPAPLADYILCFWTQTIVGSKGSYEHRVLPDGCIDIVIIDDQEPMVVGPWTVPLVARFTVGTKITGARLRPGFAPCLLGMPASELLNQSIPVVEVKGAVHSIRLENMIVQPDVAARRSALAEAFSASIGYSSPDHGVLASIRWLARNPQGRIRLLSRWVGISERHLHRRFSAAVGYGPKTFQSVLRFQRLLKAARETGEEQSLAELATSVGYSDQAHMTREVQRLSNLRPSALLRSAQSTLQMSDLFKT